MILRILIALILSGMIGFEREMNNHSAGFRTHILVGVGACLMMLLSLYGFRDFQNDVSIRFDPARIPSYVISGIGFLGAGTIIVYGGTIRGLTTAASIWAVAGLGLVIGNGMYDLAVFTTIVILLSLIFLNHFETNFVKREVLKTLEIKIDKNAEVNDIIALLETLQVMVLDIEIQKNRSNIQILSLRVKFSAKLNRTNVYQEVLKLDKVQSISDRA
ncbi:MAG TPA: MgtC/SapB family protein [Candidatus Avamphibacillus intestinigallinarum]|nr:MgtC/SapB family protein [Candidatus Avamphibacillus intestinigallinarum]